MSTPNDFIKIAVQEARDGMTQNHGGPFGAVITQNGEIIATAHNEVLKSNDPTAHAEILAIRRASEKLGRFDLSDCEIFINCEPCPMCFAAIHWAKIKNIYYTMTRDDASAIGFDDKFIYDVIKGTPDHQQVTSTRVEEPEVAKLFNEWANKTDKKLY